MIDPVSSSAANASQSTRAGASLAANFDMFLSLLTTQLQNQDPLSPMDSQAFTEQLVQFSSVEQAISTNKNLETLIGLVQANATGAAVGYLGREAEAATDRAALTDGQARWRYELPKEAASVTLSITTPEGRVVANLSGQTGRGDHDVLWNGEDARGNRLPDGEYRLRVTALDADGRAIAARTRTVGLVTAVDLAPTGPELTLGGITVPLSAVTRLTMPAAE